MNSLKSGVLAKAVVDYSEDLELNVKCDDGDDGHNAVVHCPDCMANFCKKCSDTMHAFNIFSKHVVVRLSKRKPISCHIHPQETAHLICKEPDCRGGDRPICLFCHQYDAHKGHEYELLEKKYTETEATITKSSKEVETKQKLCGDKVEEFGRLISEYSTNDDDYMKSEREKIEKFYFEAKESALRTLDDYRKNQVETMKALQSQYENDKKRLDNMSVLLRDFKKLGKAEKLENLKNVETLARQADQTINSLTDVEPSKFHNLKITYPTTESINIKVDTVQADSVEIDVPKMLENPKPLFPRRKLAVYCLDSFSNCYRKLENYYFGSKTIEEKENGWLHTYEDGKTILSLKKQPNYITIDLINYQYICVLRLWDENGDRAVDLLEREMGNIWCRKIIVEINSCDFEKSFDFAEKLRRIAETDKRVVVTSNRLRKPMDTHFFQ